jgi:steroid 5-alpha reductase family enzyme
MMMIALHWFYSLLFAQTWMFLAWLAYRHIGNPMLADIAWGLGITLLGWIHVCFFPIKTFQLILMALLTLWGLRLSFYLYWTRLRQHWHDKRYQDLEDRSHNLLINYQIQGLLQFMIAIPWFFIGQNTNLFCLISAVTLFTIGFCIECVADWQLQVFKKHHTQQVCQLGLWQYSRHPNYFGECLIWLGFAVAGCANPLGFIGMISPVGLYLIMSKITGPLTENSSIKSRGKVYLEYQQKTPMIIPRFKRNS